MTVRSLQHIALAVPDATVGKKFYTDFGMEGRELGKRIVMRCQGRDQDQVILVEGRKKHMHHVCFGTKANELDGLKIPLLIGVAPIPSARSARWMKEKLFGTIIPDKFIERLEQASDPKAEGRKICIEVLRELAEIPGVAGAHVMAPMAFSEIPRVIEESGVSGRKLSHAVH